MGDLLIAVNAGAYSRVSATTFNGFSFTKDCGLGKIKRGGNAIKLGTLINLIVILLVLGVVFLLMSPETDTKMSALSEITIGALVVFIVVTLIRMIIGNRKK